MNLSHYRAQFKSGPNQTWHNDWLCVSDSANCWTLWSGDHSPSGPLVSIYKMVFSYTLRVGDIISSWISTKLLMMMAIVWCHGMLPTAVLFDWFLELQYQFTFSLGPKVTINDDIHFSEAWSYGHIRSCPVVFQT